MSSTLTNPALPSQDGSHSASLNDVVVSHELLKRPIRKVRKVNARAEITALHTLAILLPAGSSMVFKRLAELAVELCDAGSGGISMLEVGTDGHQIFRWQALAGELETYQGGTTPRDWSPCGECLNSGTPMLYSYPARFFTYFQSVDTVIVEGLVIPMYVERQPVGTIWILSHNNQRTFDAEDVRVMTSLGSFVTAALNLSNRRAAYSGKAGIGQEAVWGELVSRVAGGDAAALEALIDETKPLVFARALRFLSFRADAEEITADVYTQVWKTARGYDPERYGPLAWLLTIARSRSLDRLRSRASHNRRSEVALSFECSSTVNPEDNAVCDETRMRVRRALGALSLEQQRAIELAYFDGYSMPEIASRLGHPLGTVKSRIRTGLIALRRLIATAENHRPA
jgi:RNA polymerase sigma factor (sigma-70 family)